MALVPGDNAFLFKVVVAVAALVQPPLSAVDMPIPTIMGMISNPPRYVTPAGTWVMSQQIAMFLL
jgi:hypothetical protein